MHSVGVGDLAAVLAHQNGWDPAKARLAGLLHDYAKEWGTARLLQYVRRHKVRVPNLDFIRKNGTNLLHAYVSADVVKKKGWIRDKASLRAIASHTLGSLRMGTPEAVLYIADFAAPDRTGLKAEQVLMLVKKDLRKGLRAAMAFKIEYNLKTSKPLHPLTVKVWNRIQ